MREMAVEEQIQQVLSYVQRELVNIWKENIIKSGDLNYAIVGEFLADLKQKFRREDNKIMKMVKLKRIEQEEKTIEKFVQEFRRVARESEYVEK